MKWGAGLILLVAFGGCTKSNPSITGLRPGETCSGQQFCGNGGTYALCQLGAGCRYVTSDGSSFNCLNCGYCAPAQLAAAQWCLGGGGNTTSGGGNTTSGGGNTTSGGGNTTSGGGNTTSGGGNTTSGGGNTTGGGTTSGGGGTTGGGGTCAPCQQTVVSGVCSSTMAACQRDSKCVGLITCLQNCASGDSACQNSCATTAGATAVNEYNGIGECICNECTFECVAECAGGPIGGGTTGGTTTGGTTGGGTTGGPTPEQVCGMCEDTAFTSTCKTQVDACNATPSCVTLANCTNTCSYGDTTCLSACTAGKSSLTLMRFNAVVDCLCVTACKSECGTVLPACTP
jgi:hypothetical protein